MRPRFAPLVVLLTVLAGGCTSTALVQGRGDALLAIRALPEAARPRIAVLPIVDRSPAYGARSVDLNLVLLNLYRPGNEALTSTQLLSSLRTMLTTELFASQGFIVLERDELPAILTEQAFSQTPALVNPATAAPAHALEGAQYLLAVAITGFDTGSEGAALPIPIPASLGGNISALGVLSLGYKKSYVSMDLRVLDAATGRVLQTVAVEGSTRKYGLDLTALVQGRGTSVARVPELIQLFKNTPMEAALQEMTVSAVAEVAKGFLVAPSVAQSAAP